MEPEASAGKEEERLGRFAVLGAFAFAGVGGVVQVATSDDAIAMAAAAPGGLLLALRGVLQLRSPAYRARLLERQKSLAKQYPQPTVTGSAALVVLGLGGVIAAIGRLLSD